MCGICGFISKNDLPLKQLEEMNSTMAHRGPDDSGANIFSHGNYYIGMAQRRLSIIDLSPLGHQPMFDSDKSVVIVFNGEIYNYQKLRSDLEQLGYHFVSSTDTEVIINSYKEWGIECLQRMNGMFAFALYDFKRKIMFLARDRIGKKPLYYYYKDGLFIFASELKPIMKHPQFPKNINTDILGRFLYHQYINAPDTIFESTFKLEPGYFLIWENGFLQKKCYWNLIDTYYKMSNNPILSYAQAKSELTGLINEAVNYRMISDVPLGTFLSGGIDSTIVTAFAQKNSISPIKTYSIGFFVEEENEAQFAKEIAHYIGTDHHEMYIDENTMLELVDSIPVYYDEPFADSSQIPSMLVSQLAKQDITVALSGDGGDELFCGYNIYDAMISAKQFDFYGGLVYKIVRSFRLLNRLPFKIKMIAMNRDLETKTQFGGENYISRLEDILKDGHNNIKYKIESQFPLDNWQIRRMLLDMITYLPGDILTKVDRASMKYSLETRCPLLDKNIIEYSFRIPHQFKYYKGDKKRILKDIVAEIIPYELLDRPKKGFSVPLERWLRSVLADKLLKASNEQVIKKQGIFIHEEVREFIDSFMKYGDKGPGTGANYSKIIWSFLVFQMWYDKYIDAIF